MREIETRAIEAIIKIMEGTSELTDILMSADNGAVDEAFNNSEATNIYPSVFCKSFEELDLCVWGEMLIKAISNKSERKERWMVKSYGGGEETVIKYFSDGSYDEMLSYVASMKEDYLVVKVYEYKKESDEYKLLFAL